MSTIICCILFISYVVSFSDLFNKQGFILRNMETMLIYYLIVKEPNQPSLNRRKNVQACPTEKYIVTFQTLVTATQMLSSGLDLHLHLSALLFSMLLTSQPVPFPVVGPRSLMPVSQCMCVRILSLSCLTLLQTHGL